MKTPTLGLSFLLSSVLATAAEPVAVVVNVSNIPADATQLVLLIDGATPRSAPNYEDLNPPPAAQPAAQPTQAQDPIRQVQPSLRTAAAAVPAPANPVDQPPQGQRRRRQAAAAAPIVASVREAMDLKGSANATIRAGVFPGDNYQARIVALRGNGPFPTVIAGGKIELFKVEGISPAPLQVVLTNPALRLSPKTPLTVSPGAHFQIAGTITDGARALGSRNRMRIWMSESKPPAANYAGQQISTINVTTNGDDVDFSFELTAPKQPTTLYFQFGEVPPDFARDDGSQAPFVVLPDLNTGAKPLQLRVE